MKIKAIVTLPVMICLASLSFSQGKYGATPEDSMMCVRNLSVYVDFVKQDDAKGAYKYWKIPFDVCPKSSLKMYVDGVNIIRDMIEAEESEARKKALIDTLLLIHDRRIENFGKEGYVLGRKGAFMYKYETGLQEAFETMDKSIKLEGNNSEAATLVYHFVAGTKLAEEDKIEKSRVIEMFTKSMDIIDYNLKNEKNERIRESYQKAQENIEAYAAPYLSCETIEGIVEKNFEVNKGDAGWLEKMANLLDKKDCEESPSFYKVANRSHELNPTAESAKNMGILSLTKKQYQDAERFLKQSVELVGDNKEKKAEYEFLLAKTYYAQGQYSAARQHSLNAANLKSGWGEPYILIGDMYAASFNQCEGKDKELKAVYWAAIDKYIKAKNADPSLTDEVNKKIATYSQHFPTTQEAFFHTLKEGDSYTVGCWINETTTVRLK